MVSDIASRDHGCLLRTLNPENESYFNLDILLLFRVREILGLRVSESRTCECSRLLCNTLTSVPATQPLPQATSSCLQPVGNTAPCCQRLPSKWDQLYSAMMISACSQACHHYCCSSSASLRHTCLSGIPGRAIKCAAWEQHHVPLEIFLRNLSTHFCAIFFCIIFLFDSMGIVIYTIYFSSLAVYFDFFLFIIFLLSS